MGPSSLSPSPILPSVIEKGNKGGAVAAVVMKMCGMWYV